MEELQTHIIQEGRTEEMISKEKNLLKQLEDQRQQEEILWKQKSRIRWLKEGERNTKFFHRSTIQRRMHNNINFLQNQAGERLEEHQAIEAELTTHFKMVLQEDRLDRQTAINKILPHIPKLISEEHNQLLLRPVSLLEVEQVVAQNKEGKAPGPDGFTACFFHHF